MSRGWESKDVESQMNAAAEKRTTAPKNALTPEEIRIQREREGLELSRKRVLHDIENATHIRHRLQLEAALHHLDKKLKELDKR